MRWKQERPKEGSERIIKRFAIVPLCLNGSCRWLETVYVLQKLERHLGDYGACYRWVDVRWARKVKYLMARNEQHYREIMG